MVLIADGRRKMLGLSIAASVAETFWAEFPRSRAFHGLRRVKLVMSDVRIGLIATITKVMQATCRGAECI